jgi:hypothetical protein
MSSTSVTARPVSSRTDTGAVQDRGIRAIPTAELVLVRPELGTAVDGGVNAGHHSFAVLGVNMIAPPLDPRPHFAGSPPENTVRRGIPLKGAVCDVPITDHVLSSTRNQLKTLLALAQRMLGLLGLGDVVGVDDG